MKVLKIVLGLLFLPVLLFGLYVLGNILYGTVTDYQPPEFEELTVEGKASKEAVDSTFEIFVWNIGFAGLGANADFFYDGGKSVRSPEDHVNEYFTGILDVINLYGRADFVLLQEVDRNSKRSYGFNQYGLIAKELPEFMRSFAQNYLVNFIPIPFENPMGRVNSGLAFFSRVEPKSSKRYSFPGNFDWPKRIYFLDRCFLVNRYPAPDGKELIVINTHNSAYDDGGLKEQQMAYLKEFITAEYAKKNYVVVAGDWNQAPPGETVKDSSVASISEDYLPDWYWIYELGVPTNRSLETNYIEGETDTKLIDFVLISPNLSMLNVHTVRNRFMWSDHEPVIVKLQLGAEAMAVDSFAVESDSLLSE